MPLQATSGAASYDGFGGGVPFTPTYIEDVFSTWLYTGNGSTQTITNGIDLSTKGGLVWLKTRSVSQYHYLFDTSRGPLFSLSTNATDNSYSIGNTLTAFNSNGFNLGLNSATNGSGTTFASWTFREQPKFFDIVTYTGDGSYPRSIAHNLGSVPGCVIIKRTDVSQSWVVWHRSFSNTAADYLLLEQTSAVASNANTWGSMTSTTFGVNSYSGCNINGSTYVAYLFAHNAGGFGLTGTDNVISCGSFTADSSGQATVSLGYEPQWLMMKNISASSPWWMYDSMRGWTTDTGANLLADSSSAEGAAYRGSPNATGFTGTSLGLNNTYVYIAIRRGPMKTPTTGTSVFTPAVKAAGLPSGTEITVGFPYDMYIAGLSASVANKASDSRLTQNYTENTSSFGHLYTTTTGAETSGEAPLIYNSGKQNSVLSGGWLGTGPSFFNFFRRAPGFFDVVCYRGNDTTGRTVAHNLGVVPELIIVKCRTSAIRWAVYSATLGNTKGLVLNTNAAEITIGFWGNTTPTSTVFTVDGGSETNQSGNNYVSYLFATCPGVSKVGSYTGTGALQTINCGFTGGARFVLIKRTDSTGDWFTYDSARGISSGNDPYLLMNSTAAEVTGTNYVDTTSVGFQVTAAAPAGLNASGGTYIFLAIA